MVQNFWLMKSEPETFGLDKLASLPDQTTMWDGVRNYQARNMLRDDMKRGDLAFFYHSNCRVPGIVGIVKIVREGYPDPTAQRPESPNYDPASKPDNPRWYVVEVKLVRALARTITLTELKADPLLAQMPLVRRGNRLSIMPVSAAQWQHIIAGE
ncbi:MAG: EVE domain-containing protein [Gammaproteobacteria bacterium]|nr:EVE domain-containing protein [Gammaproteobacteria bacterium]